MPTKNTELQTLRKGPEIKPATNKYKPTRYNTTVNGHPVPVYRGSTGAYNFALPVIPLAKAWQVDAVELVTSDRLGSFEHKALDHGLIIISSLRIYNLNAFTDECLLSFSKWQQIIRDKMFKARYVLDNYALRAALKKSAYTAEYEKYCNAGFSKNERVVILSKKYSNYQDITEIQFNIHIAWLKTAWCQKWIHMSLHDDGLPEFPLWECDPSLFN